MNIKLTISLLASNRKETLKRCLDSLKPLLLKIPSELIIVFTGEDEEVLETARRYACQVIPFAWCDDFSAARNAGLKEAKGEWFLYLDDDEWFEDVEEICAFFQQGEDKRYSSAHYIQRNYLDFSGLHYVDYSAFRMAKRAPGLRFENPIHEQLCPAVGPVKYLTSYVHHYGYAGDKEASSGKTGRNIPLLEKEIAEHPEALKNYLQLAKEYCVNEDWAEAEKTLRKGRKLCRSRKEDWAKGWITVYLSLTLARKENKGKAAEEIESMLKEDAPKELVSAMLYHYLTMLYAELERPREALRCARAYEEKISCLERNPRLWEEQAYGDMDRGMVMEDNKVLSCYMDAISCALKLGEVREAQHFLQLLPWEEEYRMQQYYPVLERWAGEYGSRFLELLGSLSYASPYLAYQRALEAVEKGNPSEAEKQLIWCMKESADFYLRQEIIKKAILCGISLGGLCQAVDLETWKACTTSALSQLPYRETELIEKAVESVRKEALLQGLWLEKLMLEKKLTHGFLVEPALTQTARQYGKSILKYYQYQYQERMFAGENERLLPRECRFAQSLLKATEKAGEGEYAQAVRQLKEALRHNPKLSGTIHEMVRQLKRKAEGPSPVKGEEFAHLAVQMKEALREMAANGEYAQAIDVTDQLLGLTPDDLELLVLRQRILRKEGERTRGKDMHRE